MVGARRVVVSARMTVSRRGSAPLRGTPCIHNMKDRSSDQSGAMALGGSHVAAPDEVVTKAYPHPDILSAPFRAMFDEVIQSQSICAFGLVTPNTGTVRWSHISCRRGSATRSLPNPFQLVTLVPGSVGG